MDRGLFQKDVAKFVGVSTDTVTYWEKGRTKPSKKNLREIKQFLIKNNINGLKEKNEDKREAIKISKTHPA